MTKDDEIIICELNHLMAQVESATSMSEISQLASELERMTVFLKTEQATPELKKQFLTVCDQFSSRLINHQQYKGTQSQQLPLDGTRNWSDRIELSAKIRKLAASFLVGAAVLKMESFESANVPNMALVGNKMDPGIYYQNIDSQLIKDNQVVITRRKVFNSGAIETRTQMKLQLTAEARKNLDVTLQSLSDTKFVQALGRQFGAQIKVTENVNVNYEVSQSPASHGGIIEFKESSANFAHMTCIDIEGVGQILIGKEDMHITGNKEPQESSRGRYLAHHTVIVRLKNDPSTDEQAIDISTQINQMHQLFSAVGLSSILTTGTVEERQKSRVLQIIETYLPHLAVPLKNSGDFISRDALAMQQFCLELLPETANTDQGEITQQEMKAIFKEEMEELRTEKTIIGNEIPKLKGVAHRMRDEGAVGFFAGIHTSPGIVASLLKNGGLSADTRSSIGFKFPSTCQEDALTGGNEAIFVRLATKGAISHMGQKKAKLSDAPYIQTYQMIASLDAANLPHNSMHHNSFGLINPLAEVVIKKDNDSTVVSGRKILESENPIQFTKKQQQNFTIDNEVMLRIGALNPQYIQKITYQDSRKELINFLETNSYPSESLKKIFENPEDSKEKRVLKNGNIPNDVKLEIIDFLKKNKLVIEKDNWNKTEKYLSININSEFKFGDNLEAYFIDPRLALIQELNKLQLIDGDNKIYGKPVEDFIVETNTLTEKLFD